MTTPWIRDGIRQSASLHLVEEIGDRVVDEYSEAIRSLSDAASKASSERAKRQIASAAAILGDYAELHRALLAPQSVEELNLGDYVARICKAMLNSSLAKGGVGIELRTDEVHLPADRCWRIGLVIAELIRNGLRNAGGAGALSVDIRQHCDQLSCTVCDSSGSGALNPPARGRRIMQSIAIELGGLIGWATSAKGDCAQLHIPADDRIAL